MIIEGSRLVVADNSGAQKIKCIRILKKKNAGIGDVIVASVTDVVSSSGKIKKGSKHLAVVVRTVKETSRPDGSVVKFDENAAVLINRDFQPIGTRIFGIIPIEIKSNYPKIISLAPESV